VYKIRELHEEILGEVFEDVNVETKSGETSMYLYRSELHLESKVKVAGQDRTSVSRPVVREVV